MFYILYWPDRCIFICFFRFNFISEVVKLLIVRCAGILIIIMVYVFKKRKSGKDLFLVGLVLLIRIIHAIKIKMSLRCESLNECTDILLCQICD